MTDESTGQDGQESQDAAREAAQHVADSAESWEHGAQEPEVREHLEEGLDEAGVEVSEAEKDKLVEQVRDEDETPVVDEASPES